MNTFTKKHCVPCKGSIPPLTHDEAQKYLKEVPGWELYEVAHFQKVAQPQLGINNLASLRLGLEREFKFKNFKEAVAFVNKVAELAESEGHHPNIFLHSWNKVRLTLSTHAIGGLSENDFIMAAKVNGIS